MNTPGVLVSLPGAVSVLSDRRRELSLPSQEQCLKPKFSSDQAEEETTHLIDLVLLKEKSIRLLLNFLSLQAGWLQFAHTL